MTTNESLKFLNEEGEQHCGTRPYDGPDDDGVHLNGPWHLPHHPGDQYIRGSLETANSHLPIPYNDPLLSTTAGYSSLGHYIDHPNTLEGDLSGFSRGPSPSPLGDVGFPQMPGSSPESSSSANFQQSFFSRPHFPYGPYPSGQHHDSSRHESHYSPRASLTTESYGITEPIPEHSLLPIDDVFPNAAVSEHAYPAGMGAQNSGLTQDSMTAIPGSTTDSSTATVLIGDSTTYHQVFSGGVEGSAEGSLTGHGPPLPLSVSHPPPPFSASHPPPPFSASHPPLPFSVSQNAGETSPSLQPEVQESYSEIVAPSNTANRSKKKRKKNAANLGRFRCRTCRKKFVQEQGRNRHEKDKHGPQMICRPCGEFVFSPGRMYMFRSHLEEHHPEDAFATDWADVANLADWVPPAGTQSHI